MTFRCAISNIRVTVTAFLGKWPAGTAGISRISAPRNWDNFDHERRKDTREPELTTKYSKHTKGFRIWVLPRSTLRPRSSSEKPPRITRILRMRAGMETPRNTRKICSSASLRSGGRASSRAQTRKDQPSTIIYPPPRQRHRSTVN